MLVGKAVTHGRIPITSFFSVLRRPAFFRTAHRRRFYNKIPPFENNGNIRRADVFASRISGSVTLVLICATGIYPRFWLSYSEKKYSNGEDSYSTLLVQLIRGYRKYERRELLKLWSDEAKKKIQDTFLYLGTGTLLSSSVLVSLYYNPVATSVIRKFCWPFLFGTAILLVGSGAVARFIPYKPRFGIKQVAWLVHSGAVGAIVVPLTIIGGPIVLRAAYFTVGSLVGLSATGLTAPCHQFLQDLSPAGAGCGAIVATTGSHFMPLPTAKSGFDLMVSGHFQFALAYFGGVLFALFIIEGNRKMITEAANLKCPNDPINSSMELNPFLPWWMISASNYEELKKG